MSLIDSTEPPVFADKRLILVLTSAYGWCVPGGLGASAGKVRKSGGTSWMRKSRLSWINITNVAWLLRGIAGLTLKNVGSPNPKRRNQSADPVKTNSVSEEWIAPRIPLFSKVCRGDQNSVRKV